MDRWAFKDAKWWQFWRPQSGLVGGLIMGVVMIVALCLAVALAS